ncbi:hypothetical protein CDAR_70851 [Caerostris darwini]|uniref:Uncharacterized protein n=1 Tax=Caerostris darwini TaxID=1538125 RepID=A0AAV4WDX6_9ARAC|nr:hypothetical protein CDAR_70851 [Caerostris darwini]
MSTSHFGSSFHWAPPRTRSWKTFHKKRIPTLSPHHPDLSIKISLNNRENFDENFPAKSLARRFIIVWVPKDIPSPPHKHLPPPPPHSFPLKPHCFHLRVYLQTEPTTPTTLPSQGTHQSLLGEVGRKGKGVGGVFSSCPNHRRGGGDESSVMAFRSCGAPQAEVQIAGLLKRTEEELPLPQQKLNCWRPFQDQHLETRTPQVIAPTN